MSNKAFFISLILLGLTSCGYFNSGNATDPDLSRLTDTGLTAAAAIADDLALANIGITTLSLHENETVSTNEFTCTGDWTSCNSSTGQKTRSAYCVNPSVSYTKDIVLSFFNSSDIADTTCAGLSNTGDYVLKTGTETLTIPNYGTYTVASTPSSNYGGALIGGGSKAYRNTDGTISVSILGLSAVLNTTTTTGWNHTIRTDPSAPLVMNQLAREGRIISSGTVIAENNLGKFTANLAFSNVRYGAGCCYPVGGTITETMVGTRSGTATLTFTANCGTATLVTSSATINVGLETCLSSVN